MSYRNGTAGSAGHPCGTRYFQEDPPNTARTPRRGDHSSSPRRSYKLCYALQTASPPAFSCARADSKTGRRQWIPLDPGRISIGLWSAWKAIVDNHGGVMPMEGLEPSTLSGLVFETSAYTGSATSACIASIASIIIAHH